MPRGIEVTQARAGRAKSQLPVAVAASRTVKHGLIPAQSRLIETSGRRCGSGRDGSESGRSVERSRGGWLSNRLPARLGFWLLNDVPACRGLAVVWLKRGASASKISGIGRARHGL